MLWQRDWAFIIYDLTQNIRIVAWLNFLDFTMGFVIWIFSMKGNSPGRYEVLTKSVQYQHTY